MASSKFLLSVADLLSKLNLLKEALLLDCRFDLMNPTKGEQDFEKAHIPQALYVHLDRDLCGPLTPPAGRHPLPSLPEMEKRFSAMGVSNDRVVICYDGGELMYAARCWWMLHYLGHPSVMILDGGWAAWVKANGPQESGKSRAPLPRKFQAHPQSSLLVDISEIENRMKSQDVKGSLVDARDPARYRGEVEPIDSVAGHIPGAQNLFFKLLLTSEGKLKEKSELRSLLEPFFTKAAPTFYCGSGVTACVPAFAAAVAELPEARVYAGSWSEWIRNPKHPVERQ